MAAPSTLLDLTPLCSPHAASGPAAPGARQGEPATPVPGLGSAVDLRMRPTRFPKQPTSLPAVGPRTLCVCSRPVQRVTASGTTQWDSRLAAGLKGLARWAEPFSPVAHNGGQPVSEPPH